MGFGGLKAQASSPPRSGIWRGADLQPVTLTQLVAGFRPGDVLVIGENHENPQHQAQQLELLKALRGRGLKVNVGMEFLTYIFQDQVDSYVRGDLDEADFLKEVQWGGSNFDFYRDQILFARQSGGRTYALNFPRSLSSKVVRGGLSSLSPEEAALLPPDLTLGNGSYFERFLGAAGSHVPDRATAERYFLAQSLWDDTMAWRARLAMDASPDAVLVIVVGEFHAQYGGGLPERLRARGLSNVRVLSQLNLKGLSESEVEEEIKVHPIWGVRADELWLSEE